MASPPPSPSVIAPAPDNANPKPFRFKRKRPHSTTNSEDPKKRSHRHHHRHHHHHHHPHHQHRSRRRPHTPPTPSSAYPPHSAWSGPADADTAFRESLFDALADDEGAAFWEGVYGQPVHTYSPYCHRASSSSEDVEANGEPKLERMTDDEYVSYVRARMWEKSHGYIFEERRRREEEWVTRKEREAQERRLHGEVEEALRRGKERRRRSRWKSIWEGYRKGWEERRSGGSGGMANIVWPVESAKAKDVSKEEVERFYRHAPQAAGDTKVVLLDLLKKERVKWHPDKVQQMAGDEWLDGETMKLVTAVFQTIDWMWNDLKGSY